MRKSVCTYLEYFEHLGVVSKQLSLLHGRVEDCTTIWDNCIRDIQLRCVYQLISAASYLAEILGMRTAERKKNDVLEMMCLRSLDDVFGSLMM